MFLNVFSSFRGLLCFCFFYGVSLQHCYHIIKPSPFFLLDNFFISFAFGMDRFFINSKYFSFGYLFGLLSLLGRDELKSPFSKVIAEMKRSS